MIRWVVGVLALLAVGGGVYYYDAGALTRLEQQFWK
jgi:hypothetical protein